MTGIRHPSFSVVIESENLAVEDSEALLAALGSLANQTLPIELANELILVNSGRIPADIEAVIRTRYPRLRIENIDGERTYYEAKQDPVALTTGEVVVFCDCDCRYSSGWLEAILAPYMDPNLGAEVVTGETSVFLTGFQSYFVALAWCFPLQSDATRPYRTFGYAANNVSFRRTLLERAPLPVHLRLYRGNCSLHARQLTSNGVSIWKAPAARALHPTLPPSHVPARFFMWGHHEARVCIERHAGRRGTLSRIAATASAIVSILVRRAAMPFIRWPRLLRQRPGSLVYAPFLLGYIAVAQLLFLLGVLATVTYPSMSLLGLARSLEAAEHHADA